MITLVTKIAGWVLFILGIVGCFAKEIIYDSSVDQSTQVSRMEVPLSGINGVATGPDGNIYVGNNGYERVHVYSPNGRFERSLYVGFVVAEGAFEFRVTKDNIVEVYGHRTNALTRFGTKGIQGTEYGIEVAPFVNRVEAVSGFPTRFCYQVAPGSWIWPRIARVSADGESSIVISQSLWLWLLRIPAPSIVFTASGIVAIGISKLREKRCGNRIPTPTQDNQRKRDGSAKENGTALN